MITSSKPRTEIAQKIGHTKNRSQPLKAFIQKNPLSMRRVKEDVVVVFFFFHPFFEIEFLCLFMKKREHIYDQSIIARYFN